MYTDRRVKSRNLVATKAGSPIIYEQVMVNATGPNKGSKVEYVQAGKAVVKDSKGTVYRIPVDKNGRVPEDALFERFCDEQQGRRPGKGERSVPSDLAQSATVVHKIPRGGFTPEQLVDTGWWQYPGCSDIAGIDDPSSIAMREWPGTKGKKREASKKIAIIAGPEDREFIEQTLASNFTGAELKAATDKSGMVIMKGNPGRGNAGVYYYKQPGVPVPKIILRMASGENYNEDTVTHEFVHHMRAVDPKRKGVARYAKPLNENGEFDSAAYSLMTTKERNTARNMEEAATVAETDARTKRSSGGSGYYIDIRGYEPGSIGRLYEEDRALLMKGEKGYAPVTGRRAVNRVNDRFSDTHISGLRVHGKGATALEGYASAGAVKPKSKGTAKKADPKPKASSGTSMPTAKKAPAKKPATKKTTAPKPKSSAGSSKPKAPAKKKTTQAKKAPAKRR